MTPERENKFREAIQKRQPDLTVIMENIHDPHNISAILRTCDAVGILDVYVINNEDKQRKKLGKKSSASARKWVNVHYFNDIKDCVDALKTKGYAIYSTHLAADSVSLYKLDFTQPIALAFGNEHSGVSEELLSHSTGNFIIPMMGMIPSLNVSVACAVTLYEAFRQRDAAEKYQTSLLPPELVETIFRDWSQK